MSNSQANEGRKLKAIILDRDGVINELMREGYVMDWADLRFRPGALDAIAKIHKAGLLTLIITNQSCIGRGMTTRENIDSIHEKMMGQIEEHGGKISAIYMCPHAPDEGCDCRKPEIANFKKAMEDFDMGPDDFIYIGDYKTDREAAERAGCGFEMVDETQSLSDIIDRYLSN